MKRDPQGYILLHRKFTEDWKWQNPSFRSAWTWLLVEAAYKDNGNIKRGQVKHSIRFLGKAWGMAPTYVHKFLSRCKQEGDITVEVVASCSQGTLKGTRKGTVEGTLGGTRTGGSVCLITILKYDEYQDGKRAAKTAREHKREQEEEHNGSVPSEQTLKKEEKEEEKKKKGDPPTQLPKKLQIEMIRSELGLYEKEFPYLDINLQFRKWKNWLENNKAPKKYKASFDNWLINAEEYRIRDSKTQKNPPNAFRKEFGLD